LPGRRKLIRGASSEDAREASQTDQLGLERLVFFSDAVFAIAITLLVLQIQLPAGAEGFDDRQLLDGLVAIWHKYLAYLISFLVIGTFWVSHHRKFRLIRRYDSTFLLLNVLMLMFVAFLPFPSAVISINPNRTATIFYAMVVALVALLMAAMWWYAAWRGHLVDTEIGPRRRVREIAALLSTAAVFLISIGIAFIGPDLAKLSWLLTLPGTLIINRSPARGTRSRTPRGKTP
jgi:uncharacterized membrane protein